MSRRRRNNYYYNNCRPKLLNPEPTTTTTTTTTAAPITTTAAPVAPLATVQTITGDSNTLNIEFDQPVFLDGVALGDITFPTNQSKIDFLLALLQDANMPEQDPNSYDFADFTTTTIDATKITYNLTNTSIQAIVGTDTLRPAVMEQIDQAGNADGIYRRSFFLALDALENENELPVSNADGDVGRLRFVFSIPGAPFEEPNLAEPGDYTEVFTVFELQP